LEEYLLRAIEQEEYEKAAQIRDEIEKLNHE
jgi:protein-arginine kinase activator protein McsA